MKYEDEGRGLDTAPQKCVECQNFVGDYYMVHDELWAKGGADKGHLHLECLELRLGRKLTINDFPRLLINKVLFQGFEMKGE